MSVFPAPNRAIKFTYREYSLLPEGTLCELIEGDLLMTPPPTVRHQKVLQNLNRIVHGYARRKRLGTVLFSPVGVYFSETTIVEPDLVFVSKRREGMIRKEYIQGPPDLVVEILSPGTSDRDLIIKRRLYARYRVQEYWIVDPDAETIEQLVLTGKGYKSVGLFSGKERARARCLKGLAVAASQIFE